MTAAFCQTSSSSFPSITGGLSKGGITTGFDFSGGNTKLPLADAAEALLANFAGVGEAAGVGFADAVSAGVGVTTAGGLAGVCAFTQTENAQSTTRKLPKERMQDLIGLREREGLLGAGNAFPKGRALLLLEAARKVPAHLDARGPRNLPERTQLITWTQ